MKSGLFPRVLPAFLMSASLVMASSSGNPPPPVTEVAREIPQTAAQMSPGLEEIIKLAQARVGDDVILAYIERSGIVYNPTVDEIVYLNDLGVSESVISALVRRSSSSPQPAAIAVAAPAPVAAPATVVSTGPTIINIPDASEDVTEFYSALSPYGSWVQVADYGWCWRPTVAAVNVSWRPYHDRGRWVYSDCGWYWHSDYSWGWAPFHYGRWHCNDRLGWVWTPDRVWGAAWVSWRSSSDFCGWAPLPPRARYVSGVGLYFGTRRVGFDFDFGLSISAYTFVPTGRLCDTGFRSYVVPQRTVTQIFNNTTIINNYVVGNNNVIINNGPGRDHVAHVSHREIPTVRVRETASGSSSFGSPDRMQRENGQNVITRPGGSRPSEWISHSPASARPSNRLAIRNESARSTEIPAVSASTSGTFGTRHLSVAPQNDTSAGNAAPSPNLRTPSSGNDNAFQVRPQRPAANTRAIERPTSGFSPSPATSATPSAGPRIYNIPSQPAAREDRGSRSGGRGSDDSRTVAPIAPRS
ncbi:MAG TPA: DUF6600 domain-containing protein, partial [Roseimicrobium sp.]|nr:DUF6600 domain-containing protein [Roseimicrobium sp.]